MRAQTCLLLAAAARALVAPPPRRPQSCALKSSPSDRFGSLPKAQQYEALLLAALSGQQRDIDIALLSDPDSAAIDAFGLRNESYANNPKVYGVPHPVVFVVSPDGEIQAKLYEESYKDRPAIEAILDEIDALG